ncbi:uncharacterized protein VTP21DRAFT_6404 [Calcarisporiella thermophila]|uniref:uncharacterized protein n=1 Tax=Calcarisporiella thermophila TaxID=911321 RepID=UPI0037437B31
MSYYAHPISMPSPPQSPHHSTSTHALAEFAAKTLCLLWYGQPTPQQGREALPALVHFCHNLFEAARIDREHLFLALEYVQRYRRTRIAYGSPGCEYRLLTIALSLANKYLNDSTFTARTWSNLSGLPLREILVMEVEFLTALDHRLHLSAQAYREWAARLEMLARTPKVVKRTPKLPMLSPLSSPMHVPTPVASPYQCYPLAIALPNPLEVRCGVKRPQQGYLDSPLYKKVSSSLRYLPAPAVLPSLLPPETVVYTPDMGWPFASYN